jgi:hypothetical protein
MRCPSCGDRVHVERAGIGYADPSGAFIASGFCPYPRCAAAAFAIGRAADDLPAELIPRRAVTSFRAWRRVLHAVPRLLAGVGALGILSFAVGAASWGLRHARSGAAIGLVLGGPTMILLGVATALALALGSRCRSERNGAMPPFPGGLRLRPIAESYRR